MEKVHPAGSLLDPEYFLEAFRERLIQLMEREMLKAQEKDTGEREQRAEQADDDFLKINVEIEEEEEDQSDLEEEEPRTNSPINKRKKVKIIKKQGETVRDSDEEIKEEKMSELPDREERKQPCFLETTQPSFNQKYQLNGLDLEDLCPYFLKMRKDYKRRKIF